MSIDTARRALLAKMTKDLENEYTHMLFYLANSATVRGLHRIELKEWLEEESASEMDHVKQFSNLLVSLGAVPNVSHHEIPTFTDPTQIIQHAIKLEQEVCKNYGRRLTEVDNFVELLGLGDADLSPSDVDYDAVIAQWEQVGLFYEDQLTHSHSDLNELRQWI